MTCQQRPELFVKIGAVSLGPGELDSETHWEVLNIAGKGERHAAVAGSVRSRRAGRDPLCARMSATRSPRGARLPQGRRRAVQTLRREALAELRPVPRLVAHWCM